MKDLVQGLGLTEVLGRLCPGLIFLASLAFWLLPNEELLKPDGILKQYEWVVLSLAFIGAYALGLILETGSNWLVHRYLELAHGVGSAETGESRNYNRRLWFFRLLVGFGIDEDDAFITEGRLRMVEQLEDNNVDFDFKKRLSLLDFLWVYRTLVSGPVGERAQPLLRTTENIRARLLFALGVAFSVLLSSVCIVAKLVFTRFESALGASAATTLAERLSELKWETCWPCIAVAIAGLGVNALLRLVTARYWAQELFFTSSLTWYVGNAEGLLTRRQGTEVVPSSLGRF